MTASMEEMTIKDIARRCGVGVSTVSRAINNHPDINQKTKDRVMQVIKETGFVPNNSARNLKRTEVNSIAVLVKGIANPFFNTIVQIIEAHIQKRHFAMVMQHVESYEDELDVAFELVKEKRLRGIIFLGGAYKHDGKKLARLNVPFIFSTIRTVYEDRQIKKYSSIAVDDQAEGKKMVEYLISLGHRKIAILTENAKGESVGMLRLRGYLEALEEYGIEVNPKLIMEVKDVTEPYSIKSGYEFMKKLLETGEEFTAVFAIADTLAVGACRALYEAGKKVPQDVSVAGFDGIPLGEYYTPQITTMKQPVEDMALKTVSLLFDVIDHKCGHQHIVFPAEIMERESTGKCIDSIPVS